MEANERPDTGERPFRCKICPKSFANSGGLKKHMVTHSAELGQSAESLSCDECGKILASRRCLSAHKKRHDAKRAYAAAEAAVAEASLVDDSSAPLDTPHASIDKPRWRCSFRPKKSKFKQTLKPHTGNMETGSRIYQCKLCSKCFATIDSLKKHEVSHIVKPTESHLCDECGKTFGQRRLLSAHKKRHAKWAAAAAAAIGAPPPPDNSIPKQKKPPSSADELKWHCSYCPMKFKKKHPLMVHERTHTGDKPLSCRFCDKKFRQQTPLDVHERWHTNDRPFECEICKKRFLQQVALQNHFRTHSGERPYHCDVCSKSFACITTLRKHQTVHLRGNVSTALNGQSLPAGTSNGNQSSSLNEEDNTLASIQKQGPSIDKLLKDGHTCQNCGKVFAYKSVLRDHMRIHTGEKAFQCTLCGKKFGYKQTLTTHLRIHSGTKRYKCSYCDRAFIHLNTKTAHEKTKHINPAAYACPICSKMLSSAAALYNHKQTHGECRFQCPQCPRKFTLKKYLDFHMAKVHVLVGAEHQCTECGKVFAFRAYLLIHMRTHSGEKPFKCRICSKSFSSNGNMRNHERIHLGIRPFVCKDCGKSFAYRSQLSIHESTHHDVKRPNLLKHVCKYCNKKFIYLCHLRAHLLRHTGEKPFKCQYCDKRYSSKNNLQVHERAHTNERPFRCTACGKGFAKKEILKLHTKRCAKFEELQQRSSDAEEASFTSSMEAFVDGESSDSVSSGIGRPVIRRSESEADQQEPQNISTSASEENANGWLPQAKDPACSSMPIFDTEDNTEQQQPEKIRNRKRKPTKKVDEVFPVRRKSNVKMWITGESPEKQAESFPCDECGKTFASKKLISAHKKRHDVKRAAAAAAATEAAIDASPDDPNAKRDTPLNKLKWRCSFFPKNFEVKQSLAGRTVGRPVTRNSKNRQHTGRQLHRCKVCSKCLATSESLAKHMAAHLANPDEPQTCDECGKTFASLKLLKVHKKRHDAKRVSEAAGDPSVPPAADDRKWQCSFCPKKFKYKHPLMVHERTHTGEKPLACRFCDKRFRQQTPLTMHERWHTNDRRHECEICKKRFLQQAALRIHFRTHSGERPYQCKICPKTFARDTTFRKHQMVHLRNKVSNILNGQGLPAGTSDNTQSSSLNDEDSTLASIQKQDDSMEDLVKSGHICPNCGKIFAYLSALNDHMRAHADVRKSFRLS